MKKIIALVLATGFIAFSALAAGSANEAEQKIETNTRHNAITGSTTTTLKKERKHKQGAAVSEDKTEVEKTVSKDGKKVETTTKETHTE